MRASRSPRSTRPLTTETLRLHVPALRAAGVLVPGERTAGTLTFLEPDGTEILAVGYRTDLCDPAAAWIALQHCRPGCPPEPPYHLAVVLIPALGNGRCGGRWRLVCPVRGLRSPTLYCPANASQFASSVAHGLRTPSDSYASHHRPLRRLQRLQAEFEARLPNLQPKGGYPGAHGAQRGTIAKWRARIAEAELLAWEAAAARLRRTDD